MSSLQDDHPDNKGLELTSVSRQVIELTGDKPPVQSFNRQLVRLIMDTVGASAITLWLVQESELVISEELEEEPGAVQSICLGAERQQKALRQAFEKDTVVSLSESESNRMVVFVPVPGLKSNIGVIRLLLTAPNEEALEPSIRAAETLSGYYSLYNAQRVMDAQQEERKDVDRLSKAILQIQHYTFSRDLGEVAVNSAMEFMPLDRVALLTIDRGTELSLEAVSSVPEPNENNAWTRTLTELGEMVLLHEEPFLYYSAGEMPEVAQNDQELRSQLNSYLLMTDVKSLLIYPLVAGENRVGVLVYESNSRHQLSSFEQTMCTVFAAHTASAVANHRAFTSLPGSRLVSRRIEQRDEEGEPPETWVKATGKVLAALLIIGAAVWFLGFYPVADRVEAKCFVAPKATRWITPRRDGVVEAVSFNQGDSVESGETLIQLKTDQLRLQLTKEKETAQRLRTQIRQISGQVRDPKYADRRGSLLAKVRGLQHRLEAGRQTIKLLEHKLEKSQLRAPITGKILSPEEPGELLNSTVTTGQPLAQVGSIQEHAQVKVAVPGARVSDVQPDYEVEIHLRPLIIDRTLHGRIKTLGSRSVTYKKSNVFMATVPVENPLVSVPGKEGKQHLLKAGMTGKAYIVTPEKSCYAAIYARRLWRKISYWLF